MAERRLTQKDIKQPDQFISFSIQTLEWAKSHTTSMLYGLLGVVVIIGAIVGWNLWQTQRRSTAEVLLYEAMQLLKHEEKAAEATVTRAQGQEQLQRIMRDYGATPAAAIASWHLGHLSFKQGDYGAALAAYEQARRWLPEGQDVFLPPLILLNIGYAQEAKGSCNHAILNFESVVQSTADWLYGEAALGIGRCYEKTGEPAKALAAYERALSHTAVSDTVRQQIEERQALLRAAQASQSRPQASDAETTSPKDTPGKP